MSIVCHSAVFRKLHFKLTHYGIIGYLPNELSLRLKSVARAHPTSMRWCNSTPVNFVYSVIQDISTISETWPHCHKVIGRYIERNSHWQNCRGAPHHQPGQKARKHIVFLSHFHCLFPWGKLRLSQTWASTSFSSKSVSCVLFSHGFEKWLTSLAYQVICVNELWHHSLSSQPGLLAVLKQSPTRERKALRE